MGAKTTPAKARIKAGTYVGDGNPTKSVTGIGFMADYVIVGSMSVTYAIDCLATQAMAGNSRNLNSGAYIANGITSIDANGFTVNAGSSLNVAGVTYYYIAAKN